MSSVTGKAYDFPVLKRVFGFVKPYKNIFRTAVTLTLLLAVLGPVRPWLTQLTLDGFIEENNVAGLIKMTILMIVVLMIQSLVQFFHNHQTNLLGQYVVRDMRVKLHRHILGFPVSYFDKTPIGTPVTRIVSDMETIADIFSDGLIVIIGDILQLAAIITYMFYIDWQLTLVGLSTIPLLLIATNVFKNKIKKTFNDVRTQVAALNVFVQEHLTGMRVVQVFNREEKEFEGFREINRKHRAANVKSVWYYSIFFPVVEILSAISIGLIVWWGARDVIRESTSFGTLVAFIMYINLLFRPIRELADKFNTLQMGMVSSERIFRVLDTPSGNEQQGTLDASDIVGEIEFRNVWFAYNEVTVSGAEPVMVSGAEPVMVSGAEPVMVSGAEPVMVSGAEPWVLKNISFKVNRGESIAFVGATGSGKTTIINLINRFYDVNKGDIFIDGRNIREYNIASLRERIAVVLQDVFLFSDTVRNNISLGDPLCHDAMLREAAEKTGAWSFLSKLPGIFDYRVGERGGLLSTGQRQLLAFMRAYVINPSILILDEATSSIDSESEALITQATRTLTHQRTSVVIAHRLATIQNASRIIVLDHGEIKETGTHEELLKNESWYYQLYQIQFKEKSETTA